MPEDVGHYYLLHRDIAIRFRRTDRWVLNHIRAGSFGDEVIEDNGDYLVPLAAFNAFVRARRVFDDAGHLKPIYARSRAQARERLALRRGQESGS
jgi:hypothetical protein